MPGRRQLRATRPAITAVPALPTQRAMSSHSHKTTTLVAWQLSPGSESAAPRFLLSAGAVNLTKPGRRQTCKTPDPESSDIYRDWIPGVKDDKEMKGSFSVGLLWLGSGFLEYFSTYRMCDKHYNSCKLSIIPPASSLCSSPLVCVY